MKNALKQAVFLGIAMLVAATGAASAGTYTITATTALTAGNGFNTLPGALSATPTSGTDATATFTYTGMLNFNLTGGPDLNSSFGFSTANVSNYTPAINGLVVGGTVVSGGTTVADFSTLGSFLNSTASTSGFTYGSLYTIDLGTLAAGTILTIGHDDGVSVYQAGSKIGNTTVGPTAYVSENVVVPSTGRTTLYYSRQNGSPSILTVSVPEPASMAILGVGLVGLWAARRRAG